MKKLTKKAAAFMLMTVMAVSASGTAFAAEAPEAPEKPVAESYRDNQTIEDYNSKVDAYNIEVQNYNNAVDTEYAQALAETAIKNEEIRVHNEAETQRVAEAEARNAQAVKDAEEANRVIDETNAAEEASVNEHNKNEDEKVRASEEARAAAESRNAEISRHNEDELQKEAAYNAAVDKEYADAVEAERQRIEDIKAQNEAIRAHNAEEDKKVSDTAAANEEEEARVSRINKEREELYLKDVAQYNADKEQYDADKAQYEKDLVMEAKIKAAGYASVEQYNARIDAAYNEPAKKSVEKNASAKAVTASDTWKVEEASVKSGRMIPVRVEHKFENTSLNYTEEFEIDANDVITFSPISAVAETTNPGYAAFYYNTDDSHQMGYWTESWSSVGTNAKINNYGWNCGDTHEISFKDGTVRRNDSEEIVVEYNYMWVALKTYKTYNVPTEPTEPEKPVLSLIDFEPVTYEPSYQNELDETANEITKGAYYTPDIKSLEELPELYSANYKIFNAVPHIMAILEDIPEADLMEELESPVKAAYLAMLDHMDLFKVPEAEVPAAEEPAPAAEEPAVKTTEDTIVNTPAVQNVSEIEESKVPQEAPKATSGSAKTEKEERELEDAAVPMAGGDMMNGNGGSGSWALLNLISAILTALIGIIALFHEDVRLKGLIPAAAAVIVFLLTEDMRLKMQLMDRWTLVMILILLVEAAVVLFSRRDDEEEEEEEELRAEPAC